MGLFKSGDISKPLTKERLSPITGKPVREYKKTGNRSKKKAVFCGPHKKGQWTPEDAKTVVADYQGFLNGTYSDKSLENKYQRTMKQIAHKANYDSPKVNGNGDNGNAKKTWTTNQVLDLLKEAKLGRGWKGKVTNVFTNPTYKVKWDKDTENRTVETLALEDVAILYRLKSGKVRVFTERGWKGWKLGSKKGLKTIHG